MLSAPRVVFLCVFHRRVADDDVLDHLVGRKEGPLRVNNFFLAGGLAREFLSWRSSFGSGASISHFLNCLSHFVYPLWHPQRPFGPRVALRASSI